MGDTIRIEVDFPLPVKWSNLGEQRLQDALACICEEYEAANPGRIMWVAGMGGKPPPHWPMVDDGSTGDFDMSISHYEIAERKLYGDERASKRRWRTDEIDGLRRALIAYRKAQRRMLERWSEGDENVRADLWRALHAGEAAADEALEPAKLKATPNAE